MDINFEYYKIFYYAAKYKNITKAASALGSSQPNITRILKLLEGQLNCRLFVREARGVSLTEQGEKLYAHVEIACRHLLNAQEEICLPETEGAGTVEIGATETALYLFLFRMLQDFKKAFPKIHIKIHNHTTYEILKALSDGRLDFAVVTTPFKTGKSFRSETLLNFQEILAGGAQYSRYCGHTLELGMLKAFPWIGLGRGTATYEFYKEFFIAHQTDFKLDMEVATSGLMLPLIQNNLGIGFIPKDLAQPGLAQQQLVQLRLNCTVPPRSIAIVSDKERAGSTAADLFYQSIRKYQAV